MSKKSDGLSRRRTAPASCGVTVLMGFLISLALGGCQNSNVASDESQNSRAQAATSAYGETLNVTAKLFEAMGTRKPVSGALGVNEKNCFTIGPYVLIAPYGSSITSKSSIEMQGIGTYSVGSLISAKGYEGTGVRSAMTKSLLNCFGSHSSLQLVEIPSTN